MLTLFALSALAFAVPDHPDHGASRTFAIYHAGIVVPSLCATLPAWWESDMDPRPYAGPFALIGDDTPIVVEHAPAVAVAAAPVAPESSPAPEVVAALRAESDSRG